MRLVEPLGLIDGSAALEAIAAGQAVWLAGGPLAFTLARLHDTSSPGSHRARVVEAGNIPSDWASCLERIAHAPPTWAGLPSTGPVVMGILNVTPDSFSDGGVHADLAAATAAGLAMARAGAAIIDVGGESTRPGAPRVHPEEECRRILPVIESLAAEGLRISVDSRNASTMAAALDAGAAIVNDISALSHDPAAAPLVAARGCPVLLMHMRGEPGTMVDLARYDDVAVTVTAELSARLAAAEQAGVSPANIAIDPGIGFAKNAAHNQDLLGRLSVLLNLGRRVLVGVSRKSFIGRLGGVADPLGRDAGSIAAALFALSRGASILRVHEVAGTVQAARIWHALQSGPDADTLPG